MDGRASYLLLSLMLSFSFAENQLWEGDCEVRVVLRGNERILDMEVNSGRVYYTIEGRDHIYRVNEAGQVTQLTAANTIDGNETSSSTAEPGEEKSAEMKNPEMRSPEIRSPEMSLQGSELYIVDQQHEDIRTFNTDNGEVITLERSEHLSGPQDITVDIHVGAFVYDSKNVIHHIALMPFMWVFHWAPPSTVQSMFYQSTTARLWVATKTEVLTYELYHKNSSTIYQCHNCTLESMIEISSDLIAVVDTDSNATLLINTTTGQSESLCEVMSLEERCPVTDPTCVAYDDQSNTLYVATDGDIIAIFPSKKTTDSKSKPDSIMNGAGADLRRDITTTLLACMVHLAVVWYN